MLFVRIPFIFGDPKNPNHRDPNHQSTTSWYIRKARSFVWNVLVKEIGTMMTWLLLKIVQTRAFWASSLLGGSSKSLPKWEGIWTFELRKDLEETNPQHHPFPNSVRACGWSTPSFICINIYIYVYMYMYRCLYVYIYYLHVYPITTTPKISQLQIFMKRSRMAKQWQDWAPAWIPSCVPTGEISGPGPEINRDS